MNRIYRIVIAAVVLLAFTPLLEARSLNYPGVGRAFKSGKFVNITEAQIAKKTIGQVSTKAVRKWKNFADYLKACEKGSAGKAFEALTSINYNRMHGGNQLLPTALLGDPHSPADLVRNLTKGLERYQLKAGFKASIKALTDPKYINMKIVTHPETLEKIKLELAKRTANAKLRNIPLPPEWQNIKDAIQSGRLTDMIDGMKVPSYQECADFAEQELRKSWNKITRFSRISKIASKVLGGIGAAFDVAYGIYMIYNAESRFNQGTLDLDLANYKKVLGGVQIGIGFLGIAMLVSPEPFSKIATPIVIVAAVTVAVLDMWIDHIQEQRNAARYRMAQRIKETEQPEAVHRYLKKKLDFQVQML